MVETPKPLSKINIDIKHNFSGFKMLQFITNVPIAAVIKGQMKKEKVTQYVVISPQND